ncbi:MAG: hypothetical protein U0Q16_18320 [Bryobacteraceae bacterium]
MPVKIVIAKASGAGVERCVLSPSPVEIVASRDADPDGKVRIEISASADLTSPVQFRLPAESKKLFERPTKAEPFTLSPGGAPFTLIVKSSLGIVRRPAVGPQSQPFSSVDSRFAAKGGIDVISPQRADHNNHNDLHFEC